MVQWTSIGEMLRNWKALTYKRAIDATYCNGNMDGDAHDALPLFFYSTKIGPATRCTALSALKPPRRDEAVQWFYSLLLSSFIATFRIWAGWLDWWCPRCTSATRRRSPLRRRCSRSRGRWPRSAPGHTSSGSFSSIWKGKCRISNGIGTNEWIILNSQKH